MRIIFMGTPEFAVPILAEIVRRGHAVVAVYTRPPKPAGRRGLETLPSPVHRVALDLGVPVFTPESLKSEIAAAKFRAHQADVAVVAAYGLILPKAILDAPKYGCLNVHASLLPRWRGAAPIERAIMAGDSETGVTIMRMEEGLDIGPVAFEERIAIGPDVTAGELREKLSLIGAELMAQALAALPKDALHFKPQAEQGATYAHKISKAETHIEWSKRAIDLHNLVRALSPRPGAVFAADFGKGAERIKVLRSQVASGHGAPGLVLDDQLTVACGDQALRLLEIQRAAKAPMSAAEFLRGARLGAGTVLQTAA